MHVFIYITKHEALKKIQGFNGIQTCDLCEYRYDALPTELQCTKPAHIGGQVIFVGSIFPMKEIDDRIN